MKGLLPLFLLFSFLGVNGQDGPLKKQNRSFVMSGGLTNADYLPGVVIVKVKAGKEISGKTQSVSADVKQLFKIPPSAIISAEKKFRDPVISSKGITVSKRNINDQGLDRIYELKVGEGNESTVINQLLKDENIEYAEPSYVYHASYAPDDPVYTSGNQSYLEQVKAPEAWNFIRNASGIIIAIVDSGSDLVHDDLASNIYLNTSDPVNGIDDDQDGYTDNYYGWDFVGGSGNSPAEDNDPSVKSDTTDHGVHVSGIASAVTDNGKGVASIAFNSAKLMIIKAGADNNGTAIYKGYEGIKYAADHGAQIINCSWGGNGSSFGQDIVQYAISKGCLIIAAAGNDGSNRPDYPAGYPGVIAVANVQNNDRKSASSNYGTYVTISAPGTNILSTLRGNRYGYLTGTSMSSPMVASAAALVKAYHPELSMEQVGERLRSTADNIDAQNPGFAGLLGKGRLNVLRALTESPPSVRNQKLTVTDKGNGSIPAGDTVRLYFDLKNFLAPANNLLVKLSTTNSSITVPGNVQTVASLGADETRTFVGPFNVYVKPGTPDNEQVTFRIDYLSGTYQDFETFTLTVSLDYLNYGVNKIASTITSNGRIGFSSGDQQNGQGFIYNGESLLYESALLIAASAGRVSDNARSVSGSYDEDFVKKIKVTTSASADAAFEGRSEFDDSNSPNPLNIYIKHRQLAYSQSPDDKYIIAEYEIQNRNNTDLSGIYAGLFTDWDINTGNDNVTRYDLSTNTAYTYSKTAGQPYAGVKLLSASAGAPLYYPMSYQLNGDFLQDDDFTRLEKYQSLSGGIKSTGLGDNVADGLDVSNVSGYGPLKIPANQSVKIAFALIGGDNLADMQNSAHAAQSRYNMLEPEGPVTAGVSLQQNFPNPVLKNTTIQFSIPQEGTVALNLFNAEGKLVRKLIDARLEKGLHLYNLEITGLSSGIYFYSLDFNKFHRAKKMIVVR